MFHAETVPISAEFFSVLGVIVTISLRRDVPCWFHVRQRMQSPMCQRVVRIRGHDNAAMSPARLVSAEQRSHLAPPRCALQVSRSTKNAEPHVPTRSADQRA